MIAKCVKCGVEGVAPKYPLCEKCWDENFSSQAEYSDKLFEEQLEKEAKQNKRINKANPSAKAIKEVLCKYWTGSVICSKCKFQRINRTQYEKLIKEEKIVQEAKKPCQKCGVVGFLYRE